MDAEADASRQQTTYTEDYQWRQAKQDIAQQASGVQHYPEPVSAIGYNSTQQTESQKRTLTPIHEETQRLQALLSENERYKETVESLRKENSVISGWYENLKSTNSSLNTELVQLKRKLKDMDRASSGTSSLTSPSPPSGTGSMMRLFRAPRPASRGKKCLKHRNKMMESHENIIKSLQ